MKKHSYLLLTALCISLFSCDNTNTNETATTTTSEPVSQEPAPQQKTATAEEAPETNEEQAPGVDQTHEVVAQNFQYSPNELRVKPDQRIQITLINQGDVQYSIKFDLPEGDQELRSPVPPGRKAGIVFTTPKKKGSYPFYSPLPNQRGRGMTGTLIVE